jgi:hypothetical protein
MVIAAHPVGPLERAGNTAWSWLVPWGLDVAMTPLTADMTLMREGRQDSYYRRTPRFSRRTDQGWQELDWNQIGFYQVRVPMLLMAEVVANGWRVEGHVHGICWQLNQRWPDSKAFKVELLPVRGSDQRLGFSREWSCGP